MATEKTCTTGVKSWVGGLTSEEYQEAEDCLIHQAQMEEFEPEIKALKEGKTITKSSKLLPLSPFFYSFI
jgi:hypothetical protein